MAIRRTIKKTAMAATLALTTALAGMATYGAMPETGPERCDDTANYSTACDGFYYRTGAGDAYTATGIRQIADDLSKNGPESRYYKDFHDSLTGDTGRGKLRFSDSRGSSEMEFRLIGIDQDVKADGTNRKAGLTFQAVDSTTLPSDSGGWSIEQPMNSTRTNLGGWQSAVLRRNMNTSPMWKALPDGVRENISPVLKITNLDGRQDTTVDRLWIATPVEMGLTENKPAGSYAYEWFSDYRFSNPAYEYWSIHAVTQGTFAPKSLWYRCPFMGNGKQEAFAVVRYVTSSWSVVDWAYASISRSVLPAFAF